MSTIYLGERQSGKTTMLIEMSEKPERLLSWPPIRWANTFR